MTGRPGSWRVPGALVALAVCFYVGVFCLTAFQRTRHFSDPDAMNIVDVATQIAAGRGIVQRTLGFMHIDFDPAAPIPVPSTSQPPLVPLLIAAVIATGVAPIDAAAVVSLLSYALIVLLVWRIALQLYGADVSVVVVVATALYAPLRFWSSSGLSDPAGTVGVLVVLWLALPIVQRGTPPCTRQALLVGAASGLAFALRYASAPVALVPATAIWLTSDRRFRMLAVFALGVAIPVAAVCARNMWLLGVPAPGYLPSDLGLIENARDAYLSLAGDYATAWGGSRLGRALFATGAVAAAAVWALWRGRIVEVARQVFVDRGAQLLTCWNVCYLGFIVVYRTFNHLDPLSTRYLLPVAVTLLVQVTAFVAAAAAVPRALVRAAALGVLLVGIATQIATFRATPPWNLHDAVAESPRLTWIETSTSDLDLILGEDVADVVFYLNRAQAVSFSPYPYTRHVDEAQILTACRHHVPAGGRAFLVMRTPPARPEAVERSFGPFIADLIAGRMAIHPQFSEVARVRDGRVFAVECR